MQGPRQDVDPLKKREEFAVSLRKKKKQKILEAKRKNLPYGLFAKFQQNNQEESKAAPLSQASSNDEMETALDREMREMYEGLQELLTDEEKELDEKEQKQAIQQRLRALISDRTNQ